MPTPALSDEQCREVWQAYVAADFKAKGAAAALNMAASTFDNRLKRAKERGFHLPQGMQESMGAAKLDGMTIDGGWIITDKDGEIIKRSTRYSQKVEEDAEAILERIAAAFRDIPAAPPIIQSEKSAAGKIAFFPQSDVHLGAEISADRGGTDYSPDIAMERMRDGFAQTHAAIPPCETAVILDNGDLTHANCDKDATPRSDHRLKVTNSHRKNLRLSVLAKDWQIQAALERHGRVIYRSNRGNHDPNTPDTVGIALKMRYINEPRVTIDDSERETWIFQQGLVFLAAHHGHGIKPEKLAANIPPNFPAEFGASRFWYLFTGHLHNPRQDTFGAFNWFQLPAICAMDQHTSDMGYSDTAAMRAMMFCERAGLKHDMTVRF